MTNRPATAALAAKLQPQTARMAMNISIEVNSIVSATAMPKAEARLSEERKLTVSASVRTISVQLTKPTHRRGIIGLNLR